MLCSLHQERLKVAAGLEMDPDVMLFEDKLTRWAGAAWLQGGAGAV